MERVIFSTNGAKTIGWPHVKSKGVRESRKDN